MINFGPGKIILETITMSKCEVLYEHRTIRKRNYFMSDCYVNLEIQTSMITVVSKWFHCLLFS